MTWIQRPHPELGTEGEVVWRRVVAILIDLILLGVISHCSQRSRVFGRPRTGWQRRRTAHQFRVLLLGFILVLVTNRKQRLGDITANTVVVRAQ